MRFKLPLLILLVFMVVTTVGSKKEIVFWHSYSTDSGEYKLLVEKIIPEFEKQHSDIKIVEMQVPYDEMRRRLITATAAAQFPDVMRMDIIWVPQFAEIGVLLAVDETFPEDFAFLKDNFFDGPLSTCYWNDHYYGLPLDTNTRILLWNKKVFEEEGLSGPPETMDEFIEYIKLLTKDLNKDGTIDRWGYADSGLNPWNTIPWIYSMGGSILDPTNSKAEGYVNSPASVKALEVFSKLYKEGCISDTIAGGGSIGSFEGYAEGVYAMTIGGPWSWSIIKGQYPDAEINYSLFPRGENGSRSVVGGEDIVIFKSTRYPKEAWEFVKYMVSYEVQREFSTVGQIPILKTLLEDSNIKEHPFMLIYLKQLETAVARSPHPAWNQISDVLQKAWEDAVIGDINPKEALDLAAQEIEAILDEFE
ncbi:extracellular solute-binding protein [Pseudothermotoga lettingae]|uniref:extracellular solute-binding protein n=1 Tax=Pseudothermotoga lettingae TaxID=177758 RepID=UPI000748B3C1|nr:extracellular solute-binding protein [Pseudothermotoga lettingae]KUK20696.1 MAG: hypothetical protein XD56_1387 [Pseudothermotoga lettingae]